MKEYLKKLPRDVQGLIRLVSGIAAKNNMPAYLVGGFVRDIILGIKNLDLDIVIEGDGIKFAEDLSSVLKAKLICHKRFGTATIVLKHNAKIDIATSRSETYPYPGSLPVVTPGRLSDDLARRDFTINAMAISISSQEFGKLIDIFGGKDDLRDKKIRVLHDLSFIDDPTRILRAARFGARYNFKIEAKTLRFLKDAVKRRCLKEVQAQRLRDEIILILKESEPLRQIKYLERLMGLDFIITRLKVSSASNALLVSARSQIEWFLKNYPERRLLDIWLIYFMALLDPLGLGRAKIICKRFVFRKGEEKRILSYKEFKPRYLSELSKTKIKPSRIFRLLEPLSYEVILLLKAKYKNKNIQKHLSDFFEVYNGMRILVSGQDLHKLGIKPGPNYQKIFSEVLNAKLNGCVKSKEEELFLIRELIKTTTQRRRANGKSR